MDALIHIKEALRMYRRSRVVKKHGFKTKYGTPKEICESIARDCYDEKQGYFLVSTGHFCEFYVRDFALCAEALVSLGHKDKVRSTLTYALSRFETAGKITTSITPDGIPFDFPRYSPDSLALLLYAITHTGNKDLARKHHAFLQQEVDRFASLVVDSQTKLPRADKHFSSIRDHAKRRSSCYDATMIAVVARECKQLRLTFTHTEKVIVDAIMKRFWNGTYFFEDTRAIDIVVGDANVFPFWTGIITDPHVRESALTAMQAAGLDDPFPLRYVSSIDKKREKLGLHIADLFASDYETDSIWIHLGLAYMRVLQDDAQRQSISRDKSSKKTSSSKLLAKHLASYEHLIKKHKTFLEVYDAKGAPFRTPFYVTDDNMIWCVNWLALSHNVKK